VLGHESARRRAVRSLALCAGLGLALVAAPAGGAADALAAVSLLVPAQAPADELAGLDSSLPGGGCAGASSHPGAASAAAMRGAVVCLVNLERVRSGLRPLGMNGRLARAAGRHAADMARRGYFGHYSPRGRGPAWRARAAGWHGRVSEVLAWGCGSQTTPLETVLAWLRSPPHREILLGRSRVAGVGLVTRRNCGRRAYWVVDLG
jgi:uncharacterized protein YkwD